MSEIISSSAAHTYKVSVTTGDVYGAGTDANVFLTIYGDQGDTGERKLRKSETNSNKFERGSVRTRPPPLPFLSRKNPSIKTFVFSVQVDKFTIEAVDLGQVFKLRIRHDNSMMHADWYLDQVEVFDEDSEEVFLFLCERWLSRKREDRLIERVFYVKVG